MLLRYTQAGYLVITPEDDCHAIVNAMLATGYNEEFCIATSFDPVFTARLMDAGFLVMSADAAGKDEDEPYYISLPKLHVGRAALFFENIRIKKSIRKFLKKCAPAGCTQNSHANTYEYELRPDADFDFIIDRCVEKHGADWLTPPLLCAIREIRKTRPTNIAYPSSFALYHNGKFAAGEFGIICGKNYTSYSGFYEEPNAGTIQLILTARYLKENGFLFFDLGMPMEYKDRLGAVNINPDEFVALFRAGIKG